MIQLYIHVSVLFQILSPFRLLQTIEQFPVLDSRSLLAIYFFFFFFSFIFISWRLITLQYCSGFCHTLTRISHGFICVPHPIPLGLHSAPTLSTCLMHPTWACDLFHP